ncbi:MAG: hypothetical protein EP329_20095 [Deltaproteobacteria bacterium]|nr:MAG: hypothetical protein EP329_20095 [Deltaproteobacteria bacterium]
MRPLGLFVALVGFAGLHACDSSSGTSSDTTPPQDTVEADTAEAGTDTSPGDTAEADAADLDAVTTDVADTGEADTAVASCGDLTLSGELTLTRGSVPELTFHDLQDLGIGSDAADALLITFPEATAAGSYDLGTPKNRDRGSCSPCVFINADDGRDPSAAFLQTRGTLTIDADPAVAKAVTIQLEGLSVGKISVPDFPGPACFDVADATLATPPCDPGCGANVCGPDACGGTCGVGCDGVCAIDGGACLESAEPFPITVTSPLTYSFEAPVPGAGYTPVFRKELEESLGLPGEVDVFEVQFWRSVYDPRSFNLTSAGENDDYATCYECVLVRVDAYADPPGPVFFQSAGTLEIHAADFMNGHVRFSLDQVLLEEVVIDPTLQWHSSPAGTGRTIALAAVNPLSDVECVPSCGDNVCGPDGCGGVCGAGCEAPAACQLDGQGCATGAMTQAITVDRLVEHSGTYYFGTITSGPLGAIDSVDRLLLRLAATTAVGSHDLTVAPNDDYGTCAQCVSVSVDTGGALRRFFQSAGTIELMPGSNAAQGYIEATLTGVELVEIALDDGVYVPVAGGATLTLPSPTTVSTFSAIRDIQLSTDSTACTATGGVDHAGPNPQLVVTVASTRHPVSNLVGHYVVDGAGEAGDWIHLVSASDFPTFEVGDQLRILQANPQEYWCETQIFPFGSEVEKIGTAAVPDALVVASGADLEPYEGALVTVSNVTITDDSEWSSREWLKTDSGFQIDTSAAAGGDLVKPSVGTTFQTVTGFVRYTFSEYHLAPRSDADLVQ